MQSGCRSASGTQTAIIPMTTLRLHLPIGGLCVEPTEIAQSGKVDGASGRNRYAFALATLSSIDLMGPLKREMTACQPHRSEKERVIHHLQKSSPLPLVLDVVAWLKALDLDQYSKSFLDNGVDSPVLPRLT
jgi:hypothetical protein